MHAIVARRYGPPEVLEWREVPEPAPQAGEVLIRVRAVGINFADLLARMGVYPGVPKPPFVPGLEVAGVVDADPDGRFPQGRRVAALSKFRAYAERIAVPAAQVFPLPEGIPFEDGAALPVNYLTAYHSMFHMGHLGRGDRVLIHGAAGGVGVAAVQLARAHGLVVFGTAGPSKQEFLERMGVDHPLDYTKEDFEEAVRRIAPGGIEMVLDPLGGKSFAKSYRCLGPTGRLILYGFSTVSGPGGRPSWWRAAKGWLEMPRFSPLRLMQDNTAVIGVHLGRLERRGQVLKPQLEEIFRLYAAGQVKPVIGRTFPLRQAAEAHRHLHARQNVGKVVLTVD